MIIDGKNLILGRLATYVAKQALLGNKVDVVNCEDILISGDKYVTLDKFKRFREMGIQPHNGPFQPRMPDRLVRRSIKRMLPMDRTRGREALHRIMCHIGVPEELSGQEMKTIENANVSKLSTLKYIKVKDICKQLGCKHTKW